MSVIYHEHDMDGRIVCENCTICGIEFKNKYGHWYKFPILQWDEGKYPGISICGKCCQKIKIGFMEDLIQITATMEMQQVRGSDTAFKRTTQQALQDQAKELIKHERELMEEARRKIASGEWGVKK
jgi:hypothetical protein